MSATDDLRAQLIAQMLGWEADNHLVDAALNTGWGHASDTRASIYREIAKELMPTVREALAEAYDKGYAVATDEFVHSDYCGRTCQCNGLAGTANPWKAGS